MAAPEAFTRALELCFDQALGLHPSIVEWRAWVAAVVGSPRYALAWGANLTTAGRFPLSNGTAAAIESTTTDPTSQLPAPMAGRLTTLAWHSAAASTDTEIRVFKNGADQGTVTLDGASGSISLASLASGAGVDVAAGDLVHLEYDAGTAPANSVWTLSIE